MKKAHAPFRHVGGKTRLTQWISQYLPTYMPLYTEAFCGTASIFFANAHRIHIAALNDIDLNITTFFRVLQNPAKRQQLLERLHLTPHSREELKLATQTLKDPNTTDIDRAWAFFVAKNQGFGGKLAQTQGNWAVGRTRSHSIAFNNHTENLYNIIEPLKKAAIDNNDAIRFLKQWDDHHATHYLDPPYIADTMLSGTNTDKYAGDINHEELVETILTLKGNVILSCYDHPTYKPLSKNGFTKLQRTTTVSSQGVTRLNPNKKRPTAVETIYIKKATTPEIFLFSPNAEEE